MGKANFYPVILAGGRGTRFWPVSRRRRAKQLLALDGNQTMLQQTVARLRPLAPARRFWVITNGELRPEILRQVRRLPAKQVLAEPVGRNTAPAIGLAAFLLMRLDPTAVIGMFPADQVAADAARFRKIAQQAAMIAGAGENIVVVGVKPTRAETGYGYVEAGEPMAPGILRVRRFTEKPDAARAEEFLRSGQHLWNSGMFVWSARTLVNALREHLPATAARLEKIAAAWGTAKFASVLRREYPQCENISIDHAVLEPRSARGEAKSNLYCIPADFGWNDLGSWASLHEHHGGAAGAGVKVNVIQAAGRFELDASGNYVHAPGKFVAVMGVKDLVVVETGDALLITTRERAQDVARVVKHLEEKKLKKLL
ncbi:MAG: sugar phosphate nucleotidyltransferase [Acidobacteriota bacterium]|nr:sugar phosphate nucleotidyltransferase [Acidobacteriota bacterium]